MNNAHDEKISFCPASGSVESRCQPSSRWPNAESPLTAIFRICLIVGLSF